MILRIKGKKILLDGEIFEGYVYLENEKISAVTTKELNYDEEYDAGENYVSPGFIDIHTHGGGGHAFEGTVNDIIEGCNFHLMHGTTTICPTISAAEFESMSRSVKNIARAMLSPELKPHIAGAHLEGPYLSPNQAGAQAPTFITPPKREDYLPLIAEYGNIICRWDYAPENDKDGEFCRTLSEHGILSAAGHTDAKYGDIKKAMANGCSLVTHLYSCTSTVTREHGFRSLGVVESAFLEDGLYVEIIADGKHLPPELIRMIHKIKGSKKIALVTDSLALAGTDLTHGFMQATEFIIEDGVCKLADRSAFAGSIASADVLVRVVTKEVGLPLLEAIRMMCKTPAALLGINAGEIAVGKQADIVVFDEDINVKNVFVGQSLVL